MMWDMFEDRDYLRQARPGPQWSATIAILAANVIVFIFQYLAVRVAPDFPFDQYFALSLEGIKHGFVWQLLTFQFMHGGILHLLLNSWAIFVFGRAVEAALGRMRMLQLYFLSGIVGGLVQMLGAWLLPEHFGDAVVGASAGAFGLVAAFATLFPNQRLVMLVYFVLPIAMRARTLLWLSLGFALFGIIVPYGNVAHAAHMGGILTGMIFSRFQLHRHREPPIIDIGGESSLNINRAPD